MRVEASIVITAPIRVVFAFAANPCCWTEWMTGFSAIRKMPARTPDVGDTFDQEDDSAGDSGWVRWEVFGYEPPRALSCRRIAGASPVLLHQVFASCDGATRVTMSLEVEESSFVTTESATGRAVTLQVGQDLHRLKELLEDRIAEADSDVRGQMGNQHVGE